MGEIYILRYHQRPPLRQRLAEIDILKSAIGATKEIRLQGNLLEITVDGVVSNEVLERYRAMDNVRYFGRVDTGRTE